MKALSIWASDHPRISQLVITLSHIALLGLLMIGGFLLYVYDIAVPLWLTWTFALIYFTAFVSYPSSKKEFQWWNTHYWKLRALHFTIVLSAFMALMLAFTQFAADPINPIVTSPEASFIVHSEMPTNKSNKILSLGEKIKKGVAKIKRSLQRLKQKYSQRLAELSILMKILLLLLLGVTALALVYIIASYACYLSCSGFPALAGMLIIVGSIGITYLGIMAIKAIFSSKKETSLESS